MRISSGMLQVCSKCNNNCRNCATTLFRTHCSNYQLTLEQLRRFIQANEKSGYVFDELWLNGPGEPLLWNNLLPGLKLLSQSKSVRNISIRSNGFTSVNEDIFKYVSKFSVSKYREFSPNLAKIYKKYREKMRIIPKEKFFRMEGDSCPIPCTCICHGPAIIGDYALLHCGTVIYSPDTTERFIKAGIITKEDVNALNDQNWYEYTKKIVGDGIVEVKPGYLDGSMPNSRRRDLAICKYCYGNSRFPKTAIDSQRTK